MTGFTTAEKAIILFRDGFKCCLCGGVAEVAHHRINRGMGGRPSLNRLSNGCALCNRCNVDAESVDEVQARAYALGVKLREGDNPAEVPYISPFYGIPVWPRDDGDLTFAAPTAPDSCNITRDNENAPAIAANDPGAGRPGGVDVINPTVDGDVATIDLPLFGRAEL